MTYAYSDAATATPDNSVKEGAIFITGASGFCGTHLLRLLASEDRPLIAVGHSSMPAQITSGAVVTEKLDLLDFEATKKVIRRIRPKAVYHLAALASIARSWENPALTLNENVTMTYNLLEAIRLEAPQALVLIASSGAVYGAPKQIPVDEAAPLSPQSPYAVSKASIELLSSFYHDAYGLRIIRARAFNHSGPGQSTTYVVSSFANQIATGLLEQRSPIQITTGNPDSKRDFTDVRDVARAYRMLMNQGEPGVYNVCSDRSLSISALLEAFRIALGIQIEHTVDPKRLQPNDVKEIRGSNALLRQVTGWEPQIPIEQTVSDTVDWWQSKLDG